MTFVSRGLPFVWCRVLVSSSVTIGLPLYSAIEKFVVVRSNELLLSFVAVLMVRGVLIFSMWVVCMSTLCLR